MRVLRTKKLSDGSRVIEMRLTFFVTRQMIRECVLWSMTSMTDEAREFFLDQALESDTVLSQELAVHLGRHGMASKSETEIAKCWNQMGFRIEPTEAQCRFNLQSFQMWRREVAQSIENRFPNIV